MKKLQLLMVAAVLGSGLLGVACSHGGENSVKDLAATRALFEEQKCAMCHGANGDGGIGVNLKTGVPMTRSVEQIAAQITNGSGVMPAFKDKLNQEQIHELAKYVYTEIQKR